MATLSPSYTTYGDTTQEQSERREVDPWRDPIERYCARMGDYPIHLERIFLDALAITYDRQNSAQNKRAKSILSDLGYKRGRLERGGPWRYLKIGN
ncbi:hypothetical protein [Aurantimonas manganoxydans]|uniref:hypothetical protein n=1 Tax=Aurantimonas manganoxydans TaxID=651183 RepID=UPI000323106B|nr:hypothetical protein [Aurantimonas manganoxydans]